MIGSFAIHWHGRFPCSRPGIMSRCPTLTLYDASLYDSSPCLSRAGLGRDAADRRAPVHRRQLDLPPGTAGQEVRIVSTIHRVAPACVGSGAERDVETRFPPYTHACRCKHTPHTRRERERDCTRSFVPFKIPNPPRENKNKHAVRCIHPNRKN